MNQIVTTLLRLVFPRIPAWVPTILIALITETINAVKEVEAANGYGSKKKLTGAQKFELVADNVEAFLAKRTASIPGWSEINPARRAKLVGGLIELAVFLVDIGDGKLDMSNTRPTALQRILLRKRAYKRIGTIDLTADDAPSEE